ncbi:MAG: roadblock/LC7 domain-containing protein, partial [Candidatus Heimdallarchaeota archaeon]
MNDLEPSNSIKSKKLMEILDDIKQEGDLKGVLYSYRDGQLIKENFEEVFDIDLCSSMCASISESAQGLAKNLNEKRVP